MVWEGFSAKEIFKLRLEGQVSQAMMKGMDTSVYKPLN